MPGMTLHEVNALDRAGFVESLGWICEDSPWVAERAWESAPFATLEELHRAMCGVVEQATHEEQLALLRAHPNLGTRARISTASTSEQAGVGLDQLTPQEFEELTALNRGLRGAVWIPVSVRGERQYEVRHLARHEAASAPFAGRRIRGSAGPGVSHRPVPFGRHISMRRLP